MIDHGKLYADARGNAVFVMVAGKPNRPTAILGISNFITRDDFRPTYNITPPNIGATDAAL